MIQSSEQPASAAGRLFDLRVLIGGLFVVYGATLIVDGLVAPTVAEQKAAGININLDMGIGMLVLGVLFLIWWRLQPVRPAAQPAKAGTQSRPRSESGVSHSREGRRSAYVRQSSGRDRMGRSHRSS